ncbi:hypothetical protein H1Z61_08990 [Bacillus aquiflavi]|uniref:Uncharacterized protein n=1 Tax=Bacillus aquiflavi TaxID=2672567 RepID=A0A6B3W0Y8_9BACI|nr:hypothetical protein [Bacillus aquiflavi]MBA4537274.1 hypothetical protein [Bacillus aquiflavi]NEY81531.1 hypothetical protein [Bacillus aquiflavi]UAC48692.1 hypothetical protein K6959_01535 [Bacillus aquiflavi]
MGFGTVLGGVGMVAGFSFGMYDDMVNSNRTAGQAIAHNATATAVGLGSSSFAATLIGGSSTNPAGWAILGGVGAGLLATTIFNVAYENNWLGIQDALNWVGDRIDDLWEGTKEVQVI